jgi:hypothetical protein
MQQLQALPNNVFLQPEFATTAVPIALGAGGVLALQTVSGVSSPGSNIATLTFNSAHGYTQVKQANGTQLIQNATTNHGPTSYAGSVLDSPWTYFQLTGATVNTAVNLITFVILSIPSTTTMNIYLPLSGTNPTVTAASFLPVWVPNMGTFSVALGANAAIQYNPDNTGAPVVPLPSSITPVLPVTPVYRSLAAVSTTGQIDFDGAGQTFVIANGSAGTTRWSIYFR